MEAQEFNFQKLTPRNDIDLGIYDDAIEYAFANDDICNVALAGAYGAGKSSVIETYGKKHPERKFLHISLAHFSDMSGKEDVSVAELEGKIINQLVHLIPYEQIPQTNFAIKRKVETESIVRNTFYIITFSLLMFYICFHDIFCNMVNGLYDQTLKNLLSFLIKKEAVLIGMGICLYIFCRACYQVVRWQMNRRLFRKINLAGNNFNIELFREDEAPCFDKYLNEVLYLFENINADAVVFEDLDRFNSKLVFEGLREINTLLNRKRILLSEEKKVPLRFIFLLRDDLFMTKERTKFFDYIIPIIPVIDGSNSYDKFIEFFEQGGISDLFEEDFLRGLSLYVDDMRILKNIVNEFVVYYNRFKADATEQNNNKLLAMITYKNMFPRDFVELQTSRGYVYQLFHLKDKYAEKQIGILQRQIDELRKAGEDALREQLGSLDDLDAIYYSETKRVRVNNKPAHEFPNRAEYIAEIKKNNYDVEETDAGIFAGWTKVNIKDRFDALLSNEEYAGRRKRIEDKGQKEKEYRESKILHYRKEQERLNFAYLKDIITKENAEDIFAAPGRGRAGGEDTFYMIKSDSYFPLIKYLVRNGYIDETYPDYMTYFYANSISRQDKIFLRSITDEKAKEYDYPLLNPALVISRMRMIDFEAKECWNYMLADTLLRNPDKYRKQLDNFLYSLWNYEPAYFVEGYMQRKENIPAFAREFNKQWNRATVWILQEDHFSEECKRLYAWATLCGSEEDSLFDYNDDGALSGYISRSESFLDMNGSEGIVSDAGDFNIQKIMYRLKNLGVEFMSVNAKTANSLLLAAVYSFRMYKLTHGNIDCFLEHMYHIAPSDQYRTKNLTLIFSQANQPLAKYVEENFAVYIDLQVKAGNRLAESEETVLYVLNKEGFNENKKRDFIGLLDTKLPALNAVADKELWKDLLPNNIADDQKNIFDYYYLSGNGMDEILTQYINNYSGLIDPDHIDLSAKYGERAAEDFFLMVVHNNRIDDKKYREIIRSFNLYIKSFSSKQCSREKMQIIIQEKVIHMSLHNLHFLRKNYADSVCEFIRCNIEDYIDILTKEEFVEDEAAAVLQMDIEDEQKINLLKLESGPVSVMNKNYSERVIVYILRNLFDENEKELLFKWYPDGMPEVQEEIRKIALKSLEDIIEDKISLDFILLKALLKIPEITFEDKKILVANTIPEMERNEIKSCFNMLHLKNWNELLEGKNIIVKVSDANEKLLTALSENGFISRFEKDRNDESKFKVNGNRWSGIRIS